MFDAFASYELRVLYASTFAYAKTQDENSMEYRTANRLAQQIARELCRRAVPNKN